jgi:hypothetical protein
MKTKKLLFLTVILMMFSTVSALAQQRGTCTSGLTNAYIIIDGAKTDDFTDAISKNYTVGLGAIVKVGIAPTYLDWGAITSFTIAVSKNGVPQYTIDKTNVATYGEVWQPTLTGDLFTTDGDIITAVMTITPDGTAPQGCTTPWTYTYNLTTTAACVSSPIPYYNTFAPNAWINKLTTDYSIPVSLKAGGKITVGINPASGSIAWTSTGANNTFTGTAQEFEFDPMLVNPGDTTTLTGVYTAACGKVTTYTYILSVPLVCTPVPQTITQANYQVGSGTWNDAMTTAPIGEIHILAGSTINFGPWPTDGSKYAYSWSGAGAAKLSSTTIREPVFNDTDAVSCLLTATITYDDGCNPAATSSYTFKIIVDDGTPLAVDKFEQAGFKMYPNPVNNILNVTYNGDLKVSITHISGQQIISPRSISKQGSIDVSSLSAGIYFLKAVANGESIVKKFVKK